MAVKDFSDLMRRPIGKVLLFGSVGAMIIALMLLFDGGGEVPSLIRATNR